jgi:hypothetical protein
MACDFLKIPLPSSLAPPPLKIMVLLRNNDIIGME